MMKMQTRPKMDKMEVKYTKRPFFYQFSTWNTENPKMDRKIGCANKTYKKMYFVRHRLAVGALNSAKRDIILAN